MSLYPLVFFSHPQYLRFGGQALKGLVALREPARDGLLAETWEAADHPAHASVIANGPLAGRTLSDLMASQADALLGETPPLLGNRFPLMVRLLDVRENLPPAVHPSFEYARANGLAEGGKYEVAYVLQADEGAMFYAAGQPAWDDAVLRRASRGGEAFALMRGDIVKPGEVYQVPPGVPHAWGAGNLLYELHTTSNAIFALDWMDWDKDQARRASDLEHAGRCYAPTPPEGLKVAAGEARAHEGATVTPLFDGPFFGLDKIVAESPVSLNVPGGFSLCTLVEGKCTLSWQGGEDVALQSIRSFLTPADCVPARLLPNGRCTFLRASINPLQAQALAREQA